MHKRKYTNLKVLLPEIKEMIAEGKSHREIEEHFGLASCYDISFEGCKRLSRKDLIIPYEAHIIEVEFQPCGCGHRHIKVTPFTNSQNNDDEQCVACGGNGSGC